MLEDYDPVLLDKLIGVCAAATIVTYSQSTVAADTVAFGTGPGAFATVLFRGNGMFRYLFLLHRRDGGGRSGSGAAERPASADCRRRVAGDPFSQCSPEHTSAPGFNGAAACNPSVASAKFAFSVDAAHPQQNEISQTPPAINDGTRSGSHWWIRNGCWSPAARTGLTVIMISRLPCRVGRAKENDLVIANLGLSRTHAVLERDISGRLRLVDTNSTNGSFVNRQRIEGCRLLDSGDQIQFGSAEFRLVQQTKSRRSLLHSMKCTR